MILLTNTLLLYLPYHDPWGNTCHTLHDRSLRALTRSGANVPRRSRNWLSLGRKAMESHGKPEDPIDLLTTTGKNCHFHDHFDRFGWLESQGNQQSTSLLHLDDLEFFAGIFWPCAQDSDRLPEVYQAVPWLQTESGSRLNESSGVVQGTYRTLW